MWTDIGLLVLGAVAGALLNAGIRRVDARLRGETGLATRSLTEREKLLVARIREKATELHRFSLEVETHLRSRLP